MWMANAGTCSSRTDTLDGKGRIVIANLTASLHRGQESEERHLQLRYLFQDLDQFEVVQALPSVHPLRDEGAANAMRFWNPKNNRGMYVFVFGEGYSQAKNVSHPEIARMLPKVHPSRQTALASQLVARRLGIGDTRSLFVQQLPKAIDAGVFHNDVIATSHEDFLLVHECAYVDQPNSLDRMADIFRKQCHGTLRTLVITEKELSLSEAVATYLFNSQIVTRKDGSWLMLCPVECQESPTASQVLKRIQREEPRIGAIEFVSLRESMANGGGPACLRLRTYASEQEIDELPARTRIQDESLSFLEGVIASEYPETVQLEDFLDLDLVSHCFRISKVIDDYWRSDRP